MRHLAILALAMVSLIFFVGSKCNSGDFTDTYIFCTPGCVDASNNCYQDNSLCPQGQNECTTGLQTFLNGQNECNTLQDDGLNNNCGNTLLGIAVDQSSPTSPYNILNQRSNWFYQIGCTGTFTETDPPSPVPSASSS